MSPLVSVVVPTFNRRNEVIRALQSIVRQTYRPIEIIVVDDGSSDDTIQQLTEFKADIPLSIIASNINQGAGAARHIGLMAAQGQYVAFLDSDDYWLSEKLAKQVAVLESSPANTVVLCQSVYYRRFDVVTRPHRAKRPNESVADFLFCAGEHIATCSVMLRTDLAQTIGFKPIRNHEDWDFYLRLEDSGAQFVLVPERLCVVVDGGTAYRASAPTPQTSLDWLELWRPNISNASYLCFRARIAPQFRATNPRYAFQLIWEAWQQRALSTLTAMMLFGRLVHPNVRSSVYWVRGKIQKGKGEYHAYEEASRQLYTFNVRTVAAEKSGGNLRPPSSLASFIPWFF